jgi:hypothetical protein
MKNFSFSSAKEFFLRFALPEKARKLCFSFPLAFCFYFVPGGVFSSTLNVPPVPDSRANKEIFLFLFSFSAQEKFPG